MRNIFLVVKNNLLRLMKDKLMLILALVIMPVVICLGIYFNGTDNLKGKMAIVGSTQEQKEIIKGLLKDNEKLTLDFLDESPDKTDLIKGFYLAEVNFEGSEPKVICYGKEEIKKTLEAGLRGEVYEATVDNTTIQGKIIGFLTMYLFFGALMTMEMFLTDRENGTYVRVLTGKASFYEYIIGQIIYSICIMSVPSIIWSLIIVNVFSVNLSISLGIFAFLLFLVGILSSTFALIICTIFKDKPSATMSGSIIAMLTCLLGGCLINIADDNKVIGFIRNCIPQKRLIDLANEFNNGDLIFILAFVVIGITFCIIGEKKHFESGRFV